MNSYISFQLSDTDSDMTFGAHDKLDDTTQEEIEACSYTMSYQNTYTDKQTMFTSSEMLKLKNREKALIKRNATGYYRCKKYHADLYIKLKSAYAPYIQIENLMMMNHSWSTQKNKAMNTSAAAYAPKLCNILNYRFAINETTVDTECGVHQFLDQGV